MVKEIERAGVPVVHICNLTDISSGIGSNRILQGKSVLHPLGDPSIPKDAEIGYRRQMVGRALELLEKV
jgi:glycine reductase